MNTQINLYSSKENEIERFLEKFYNKKVVLENKLEWEKNYTNPIEMAEIIGAFIDNNDKFRINMWISIDEGFSINVTDNNANQIIKYLYERFPY